MNLSQNFTLESLTFSETAVRKGISNDPTPEQIANLTDLAMALEQVVILLGYPITIHSAFRSPKLNSLIGGSAHSAHMDGFAADFTCGQFGSPLEVCKAIAGSDIPFDQCIWEFKSWTHLSVDPRGRREVLTATSIDGKVAYLGGLVAA